MPKIEVTFDIDASGMSQVSAKELSGGRHQSIAVTGTTALSADDMARMARDLVANEAASETGHRGTDVPDTMGSHSPGVQQEQLPDLVEAAQDPSPTVAPADEARSSPGRSTSGVFISYRRDDAGAVAGRLYDRLTDRLGEASIFMDVDSIEPGQDFQEVINEAIGRCRVLLALVGSGWLLAEDDRGRKRLDDPDDVVRIEIQSALDRGIRVIPVLVDTAAMPYRDELPDEIANLVRRNAARLRHETFRADALRLVEIVERVIRGGT